MTKHIDLNDPPLRPSGIHTAVDFVLSAARKVHPPPPWHETVFSAADLQHKKFSLVSSVIEGLIPEGLSMLVGRPKIGKSWLALDIALAVASQDGTCLGGRKVEHGNVLYAACEDSQRRLQARIAKLHGVHSNKWPERLDLATGWKRLDKGGVIDLGEWIKRVERPRVQTGLSPDSLDRVDS
jgi:AAA domain